MTKRGGRKVLATASLAADGTVRIRLPKQSAGRTRLTVSYSGSATVAPSATTVTLRVRR